MGEDAAARDAAYSRGGHGRNSAWRLVLPNGQVIRHPSARAAPRKGRTVGRVCSLLTSSAKPDVGQDSGNGR